MNLIFDDKQLDSTTYRKLFEFIKMEGIEPVMSFLEDRKKVSSLELVDMAICEGIHPTLSLVKQNYSFIKFLRDLKVNGLPCILTEPRIGMFLEELSTSLDKLPRYIENAKVLEKLHVGTISLSDPNADLRVCMSDIYYSRKGKITDIIKFLSDGEETYIYDSSYSNNTFQRYTVHIKDASYVLRAENHKIGYQYRDAYLNSFDFDASSVLALESELANYYVPESLEKSKEYRKIK